MLERRGERGGWLTAMFERGREGERGKTTNNEQGLTCSAAAIPPPLLPNPNPDQTCSPSQLPAVVVAVVVAAAIVARVSFACGHDRCMRARNSRRERGREGERRREKNREVGSRTGTEVLRVGGGGSK